MKTDDLIRTLAADTLRPQSLHTMLMLGLVPSLILSVMVVWLGLGFQVDLATSLLRPVSSVRIVLGVVLGIAALRIALVMVRPEGHDIARLWPLAAVPAVALGLFAAAFLTTPDEVRQIAAKGATVGTCLVMIPLLSVLPVASVLYALRQGATTAPARAGFVAGLAGSGLASGIYALHCTEDSPLFYVTWYGLAILAVALASTVIGARVLRW